MSIVPSFLLHVIGMKLKEHCHKHQQVDVKESRHFKRIVFCACKQDATDQWLHMELHPTLEVNKNSSITANYLQATACRSTVSNEIYDLCSIDTHVRPSHKSRRLNLTRDHQNCKQQQWGYHSLYGWPRFILQTAFYDYWCECPGIRNQANSIHELYSYRAGGLMVLAWTDVDGRNIAISPLVLWDYGEAQRWEP